jgi:hypothetical protein
MNYTLLRLGDMLPTVGVLQLLLNHAGAKLDTDGVFGSRTESAVRSFQQRSGLRSDGIVGESTWGALAKGVDLPIIDSIDVWDPTFMQEDATYIRKAGGDPILIGGMCNGVEQAVAEIRRRARNIFLLRLHGHGAPGIGSSGTGHGELDPSMMERSDIWDNPVLLATVGQLASIFGPYGCVQFIQCQTGRGPKGHLLLTHISARLNVPVTGAVHDQPFNRAASFRLFGPTVTVAPKGSLQNWCRSLPPLPA